jgi:hypothetical protein
MCYPFRRPNSIASNSSPDNSLSGRTCPTVPTFRTRNRDIWNYSGGGFVKKIGVGIVGASPFNPVAHYLSSTDFSNLAAATRRDRRLILERFREEHGARNS